MFFFLIKLWPKSCLSTSMWKGNFHGCILAGIHQKIYTKKSQHIAGVNLKHYGSAVVGKHRLIIYQVSPIVFLKLLNYSISCDSAEQRMQFLKMKVFPCANGKSRPYIVSVVSRLPKT